jgi:hypothetical protein
MAVRDFRKRFMDIRIYNLENKVASDIERQYHAYENIHVHIDVTYIYI